MDLQLTGVMGVPSFWSRMVCLTNAKGFVEVCLGQRTLPKSATKEHVPGPRKKPTTCLNTSTTKCTWRPFSFFRMWHPPALVHGFNVCVLFSQSNRSPRVPRNGTCKLSNNCPWFAIHRIITTRDVPYVHVLYKCIIVCAWPAVAIRGWADFLCSNSFLFAWKYGGKNSSCSHGNMEGRNVWIPSQQPWPTLHGWAQCYQPWPIMVGRCLCMCAIVLGQTRKNSSKSKAASSVVVFLLLLLLFFFSNKPTTW